MSEVLPEKAGTHALPCEPQSYPLVLPNYHRSCLDWDYNFLSDSRNCSGQGVRAHSRPGSFGGGPTVMKWKTLRP